MYLSDTPCVPCVAAAKPNTKPSQCFPHYLPRVTYVCVFHFCAFNYMEMSWECDECLMELAALLRACVLCVFVYLLDASKGNHCATREFRCNSSSSSNCKETQVLFCARYTFHRANTKPREHTDILLIRFYMHRRPPHVRRSMCMWWSTEFDECSWRLRALEELHTRHLCRPHQLSGRPMLYELSCIGFRWSLLNFITIHTEHKNFCSSIHYRVESKCPLQEIASNVFCSWREHRSQGVGK